MTTTSPDSRGTPGLTVRPPVTYGDGGRPVPGRRPDRGPYGPRVFIRAGQTRLFPRELDRAYPLIVRGQGPRLYDSAGNCYLDATSGGAMTANLGQPAPEEIAETMRREAARCSYLHGTQFTSPMQEGLAEQLTRLAPPGFTRARFVTGGSEANEMALRMARSYWWERGQDRHRIISPAQAYHGPTMATLGLTGRAGLQAPFGPYIVRQPHIPPSTSWADPDGSRALAALDQVLDQEGPGSIAAFLAEPVSAASLPGYSPPRAFWEGLEQRRREHGFLVWLDEVVTGLGRCGSWFAAGQLPVTADIITVSKGLGCGFFPVGAMLVRDEVYQAVAAGSRAFEHGHTWDGAPLGCAAGLAVLAHLEREDIPGQVAARGPALRAALAAALAGCPLVREVRGRGFLCGISYADPAGGRPFPDPAWRVAALVDAEALDRGLILYSTAPAADGYAGDQTLFAPALNASDEDLAEMIALTADAVRAVAGQLAAERA